MIIAQLILFIIFFTLPIFAFPGDQSSLSCMEDSLGNKQRDDILNQYKSEAPYTCPSADFPDADACKENNKKLATDRVKKIVLDRYDTTKHFTMLGDSLSDFVDYYGMAAIILLPEHLSPPLTPIEKKNFYPA